MTPNICITILAPGILSWLLDFLKNLYTPGFCNILMMTTNLKLTCTESVTSAFSWNIVENCSDPRPFARYFDVDTKLLLILL